MATVAYTVVELDGLNAARITWANMANGDDGAPYEGTSRADRSVQVEGTFGSGGTLRVEGSNNGGSAYRALTDPQGNDLDIGAAKIEAVTEIVEQIRPRVTAGDGTTDLTVSMVVRRG